MNEIKLYPGDINPFVANPNALAISQPIAVTREGITYTQVIYSEKFSSFSRLIQLIQALALTVFTAFLGLFSQNLRELWNKGFTGEELTSVLTMPTSEESLQGLFQGIPEFQDVERLILSPLSLKDLFAMRATSTLNQEIPQSIIADRINTEETYFQNHIFGINNVTDMIAFFGKSCSELSKLDLREFSNIRDQDINKITESFTKINYLFLSNAKITNNSENYFKKMTSLKELTLWRCLEISDISFLKHCTSLVSLDLEWSKKIDNIRFLEHCPNLELLCLNWCTKIKDINVLQHCPKLQKLCLRDCKLITDFSFVKHCPHLKELDLFGCVQILSSCIRK